MPRTEPVVSEYARSYNSFSGVDMKARFGNQVIGELQAISYSVTREKAPIYTLGAADPRAFSRGKRGIAGTLIFVTFDRHPVLETIGRQSMYNADKDDISAEFLGSQNRQLDFQLSSSSGRQASTPIGAGISQSASLFQAESPLDAVDSDQEPAFAQYADQILPFDITLAAGNEYGALMAMRLFGVELMNEGWGVSIDDLVTESQYTFLCRNVKPWAWVRPNEYFTQLR